MSNSSQGWHIDTKMHTQPNTGNLSCMSLDCEMKPNTLEGTKEDTRWTCKHGTEKAEATVQTQDLVAVRQDYTAVPASSSRASKKQKQNLHLLRHHYFG